MPALVSNRTSASLPFQSLPTPLLLSSSLDEDLHLHPSPVLGYYFHCFCRAPGVFREQVCGREGGWVGQRLPQEPGAARAVRVLVPSGLGQVQVQGRSSWGAAPAPAAPLPGSAGLRGARAAPLPSLRTTAVGLHSLYIALIPVCFYMNNHPVCASQRTKNH